MNFFSFSEKIDCSIANLIKYIQFLPSILIYFETFQTMPANQINTRNKTNDSKKSKKDKKNEDPKKKLIRRRIIESDNDDDDDFIEDDDDDDDYETIDSTEDDDEDSEEYENNSDSSSSDSDSEDDEDEDEDSEEVKSPKRKKSIQKKKSKKTEKKSKNKKTKKAAKKPKHNHDDESEEEEDEYEEGDDSEYDDDDSKGAEIILSFDAFGGGALNPDETEYKKMVKEDKNEECDSDDEKTFMKETYVPVTMPKTHSASELTNLFVNSMCSSKEKLDKKKKDKDEKDKDGKKKKKKADTDEEDNTPVEKKYAEMTQLKKTLTEQLSKNPKNKILQNAVQECRKSISELVKKERKKNTEKYYELVSLDEDKRNTNEMSYFKKKLSHKEQMKVMNDLSEINKFTNIDKPYRLALLESNIEPKIKAIVLQKLNILKSMQPSDSEYYKMKNWVDGFMRVPHGVYKSLEVKMSDGMDKCHTFIESAKETLDNCVYGLNDAKLQIMQMVGQWITNPSAMGTAIAIKGPMGTGKTTLVKDGISKILGREFAFIALGGTSDASFLEGHSYTYEGSQWGKVLSIIMESKCMNPVIYFDELDKISDTPKGEEIIGILTHLTDTTQNSQFHDKYFSEVDFDLSKCLFIFSYNDESKVNPILRDRMYRIQTKGYDTKEKMIITRKHLLPKIREQVNFKEDEVVIPDDTLNYIITDEKFSKAEQGVRNLKRCLEIIHTKLNLFRLVKSDSKMFENDIKMEVQFPFKVERKHVDILLKTDEPISQSLLAMYV
jgi:ATP-dependent Lon protease